MNIRLYLSKQGYDSKPTAAAGIIKTLGTYELVDIDVESLYKALYNGHYVHPECGYSKSNSGTGSMTFKKQLLVQTQLICVDFDYKTKETKNDGQVITKEYAANEMPDWNEDLLNNLTFTGNNGQVVDISPTFWMESFSARTMSEKKTVANSVHLFYVLNKPIDNPDSFKKAATSVIYTIWKALKQHGYDIPVEIGKCPIDPVSTDMFQGYWGSYNKNKGFTGKLQDPYMFINIYDDKMVDCLFPKDNTQTEELTKEEIQKAVIAYSEVKSLDDIDISKCQYIKYKEYFGHQEGFHILSALKHEYAKIEGVESINSKQSLCYQVCKKLLLGHCNDFFDGNEDNFYREYRRCKMYTKKGTSEAAYINHVIRLIGDTGAIPIIYTCDTSLEEGNIVHLKDNEYLLDKKDDIVGMFDKSKINFIVAQPGLGKTVFAKSFGRRTLIIELFNSIINSEEKFSTKDVAKFKDDHYIRESEVWDLNVCSANKFVSWFKNVEMTCGDDGQCLFDTIILDESHLLCLSNYRYDVMGETVSCLKEMKAIYPNTNIIIMTGTPFGEDIVFPELNTITIKSKPRYTNKCYMIQTTSIVGYMKELIKSTLNRGLRVFIPVDSENWFDTFIESCVNDGIITKDKTFYFNQPKNQDEVEKNILDTKLIGDIKILGTSSYMSVGIDIEDWKTSFVTIVPAGVAISGNFSGIEVQQFANRHRKQALEVHYVISKNEDNMVKPTYMRSCKALLDIKCGLLQKMYRTNPIVIKIPRYLISDGERLEVQRDMLDIYTYYKDMKPVISHPANIYEYMHSQGWECEWKEVNHPERGIDTKEHRDREKAEGLKEFIELIEEWRTCNYPMINVKDSIGEEFKVVKNHKEGTLFDVDSLDVEFTNYYAKNTLFGKFLNIRELLTANGTYNLILDANDGDKINIAFIDRTLLSIRLINTCRMTGLWATIYEKLKAYYSMYSSPETGVYKNNKSEFKGGLNSVVQSIWDDLSNNVDDDLLMHALNSNYENVTDTIVDSFMDGIKLVQSMYVKKKTIQKKVEGKNTKVTFYEWDDNKLSRYEVRTDKIRKCKM